MHPGMPARTMQELVELARAQPGTIDYGSASIGSAGDLAAERVRQRTGIDIVPVVNRAAAPMMQAVLEGF
jgi:tripartite-type tricarboxylate transporter receptor subunit TctC